MYFSKYLAKGRVSCCVLQLYTELKLRTRRRVRCSLHPLRRRLWGQISGTHCLFLADLSETFQLLLPHCFGPLALLDLQFHLNFNL